MTRIGRSLEKIFKKIFRDDAFFSTPAALIPILAFAAVLSTGIISESRAGCEGCEGECQDLGCGYKCTACKEGYELYNNCWFQSCKRICKADDDWINGVCYEKCATDEIRNTKGYCVKSPTCSGGSFCRNSDGFYMKNCCYKIEGDATTLYADNPESSFNLSDQGRALQLSSNKNLIIESGATGIYGGDFNKFETVYLGESITENDWTSGGCAWYRPQNLKHLVISDVRSPHNHLSCITGDNTDIVCLGDVEACKENVGSDYADRVVAPTESQCNGSKSYYYTGSECENRPENGTDITCDHEISGYIRVGHYCASPEVTYAKKHYTPAEAAQWLKDEDNEITITFKK